MSTGFSTASLYCAAACFVLWGGVAQAGSSKPAGGAGLQYARVAVIPLHDAGNVHEGGTELTAMLAERLGARFEEVEFVVADAEAIKPAQWPVLPDEAVKLGNELGVDALIDGFFGGVEIVGGTWPNLGSDVPEARGRLRWRLVECGTGQLVLTEVAGAKKPQVYSPRIRSTDELVRRVMQDLVVAVGDTLEEAAVLAGTGEPEAEPESPGNASADEH